MIASASKESSVPSISHIGDKSVSYNSLMQKLQVIEEVNSNSFKIELVPDSESSSDQSSAEEDKRSVFKSLSYKKPKIPVKSHEVVKSDEMISQNQFKPVRNLNNSWPESKGIQQNPLYPTITIYFNTESSDMLESGSSLAS